MNRRTYSILRKKTTPLLLALAILCLSCSPGAGEDRVFYFSDRHSGSYGFISESLEGMGPCSLILLDYHHDAGPGPAFTLSEPDGGTLKSFNWLGGLIAAGLVDRIYWVSGRDLLLPNRNSRRAWLERKTDGDPPEQAEAKRSAYRIVDWPELAAIRSDWDRSGPLALSLDLDILTVDPGEDPDAFLGEMLRFIERTDPDILSLALSSAYQPRPEDAWRWLSAAIAELGKDRTLIWEGGEGDPLPEGKEEKRVWESWGEREVRTDFSSYFSPGSDLWDWAPAAFWTSLRGCRIQGADDSAKAMAAVLVDSELAHGALAEKHPPGELIKISLSASEALSRGFDDPEDSQTPPGASSSENLGLAVRLVSGHEDRGCLACYRGIGDPLARVGEITRQAAFHDPRYEPVKRGEWDDLEIEISLFGEFRLLPSHGDFIPGLDSLILEKGSERTLLQASLARERNLSRIQFLRTLSRKAGLGEEGWREEGVRLYKAPTVDYRRALSETPER